MSSSNRIREFRKLAGLSQKEVAEAVGMSQPNFQRIEAGISGCRLDQALAIAKFIRTPVDDVFPGENFGSFTRSVTTDEGLPVIRRQATASTRWHCRFALDRFRDAVMINDRTKRMLDEKLESREREGFLVFDSDARRHAVSLAWLKYFVFEKAEGSSDDAPLTDSYMQLRGVHVGEDYYTSYDILRDPKAFGDGKTTKEDTNLQTLFIDVQDDRFPRVRFRSQPDGDLVVFTKAILLYLSVPLAAVDPRLASAIYDD